MDQLIASQHIYIYVYVYVYIYIYMHAVVFDNGVFFPFNRSMMLPGMRSKMGRARLMPGNLYFYSAVLGSGAHKLSQEVREISGVVLGHHTDNEALENKFSVFHLWHRLLGLIWALGLLSEVLFWESDIFCYFLTDVCFSSFTESLQIDGF